ncbi:transporter substrate-binding domain-containing protein [Vibrio sp. Isolate23]|uniref:substrate-binding periplasmic protein n=1 Tax=Vibrio sp. Isolate23 TaxID=2908533 RepID=UPI001EFD5B08|nr:transporter substrate-binding domain-containing protein [Vibrio sp. Isolate23]MCG9682032.1 transporter substrate-binding domain-containing protein [Vibrio sp. Isolate23]
MKGLRLGIMMLALAALKPCVAKSIDLVTLEYPPYIEMQGQQVSGVAVELVRYVFHQLETPVNITVLPWARALTLVKRGRADGIFTAFKNPEREKFADFSENVLFVQNISLMALKGSDYKPKEVLAGDVSKIALCVVNGVSYGKRMDEKIAKGGFRLIFQRNSTEECAHLVRTKRADIWVNNEFGARSILVREGLDNDIEILSPPIEATPSYIAFSKGRNHGELLKRFDQVLFNMKQDGRYEALIYDYFENMRVK